ncbi:MAG: hypothetical protein WCY24_06105 [Lutispora sp.]|nr:hypothetical protein [Lutispora sp.]MDD4835295.1 hypothetical protein [Lutispora sp.]
MSCMDNYRFNNIPVIPLQQMGAPAYPYGSLSSQPMQYQMPMTNQSMQVPMQDMLEPAIPPVVMETQYTQGFLKTQIGSKVKIEFLIGTNMLVDREGVLLDVGVSYIIINETETDDLLLCDIYSIKFVRFYR